MNGLTLTAKRTVGSVARNAQYVELLDFERSAPKADGVFRTSTRGWFTFAHLSFGLLFFIGHWWHAGRTLYRDLLAGIGGDAASIVEFGAYAKVGGV